MQEYINFSSKIQKFPEFDINSKIQKLNDHVMKVLPRSLEYYNSIITIAENLVILHNINNGKASLKIVITFIKSMVCSTDPNKVYLFFNKNNFLFIQFN